MGLFSFSDSSLLVYKNIIDCCILILYPTSIMDIHLLVQQFLVFFFMEFFRFFIYKIRSFANRKKK